MSGFGTSVGPVHVASIGLADDTANVSNDISELQHLFQLSLNYCDEYQVELSAVKTKLLIFSPFESDYTKYSKLISPIHIGSKKIDAVDSAEHVGIIRSVSAGNLPHIQQRMTSHRKALASILFSGMSRRHRANPLSSLQAERIFGSPVLFSGLAALILNKTEVDTISQHVKKTTQDLLKLHEKTPEPVIFLISGSLPGEATLHLKQLTLFGMICRLPGNILNTIAKHILHTCKDNDKSWFSQIRSLCYRYSLPHPLALLEEPPTKGEYKNKIKTQITDFWQTKLRNEASEMSSLKYFKPQYMSLARPHPLLSTAAHYYDINKMVIQLRMLSGRYRVGSLIKHFFPSNTGICELCNLEEEDINHILAPRCPLLQERKFLLIEYARNILQHSPASTEILESVLSSDQDTLVQFLLDCSALPVVIRAAQNDKTILPLLFKVSRTWCYSIHRTRLKLLGRWSF